MIGYRLLPPAEEEMIEAALNYEEAHDQLGRDFLDDIQYAIDTGREHPKIGAEVAYGFRRALLRRFPFHLEGEEIVIVAVAHHSRRPGYWKGRA